MRRTRSTNAGPVAGFLLILALLVVAAACGAVGAASPSPSAAPATPAQTPDPTEQPSAAPSEDPAGEGIDLDTADDHDVVVVIDDRDDALTGAESGRAGDGMSVRWGDVQVENTDEDSLRVTWVGLPVDTEVQLVVTAKGDGYALAFSQPAPPENSDAMGFDRVLVLDFEAPVRSQDVSVSFSTEG